jgi:outer membrane protein assembly factor BamB
MRHAILAGALVASLALPASAQTVSTYHNTIDRAGDYVVPGLTYERAKGLHPVSSFHPALQGEVYAQPLYWRPKGAASGALIVATEDNNVYALDALTGAQIWKRYLGPPVQSSTLLCGDISPHLGVTGAPVIDETTATLYLDANVARANGPRHEIFALSLANGSIHSGWPVDVETALKGDFPSSLENQRGALALFDGKVFIGYGGLAGDCGDYHGFVVAVSASAPTVTARFRTRALKGGIWGQGGVTGDGANLFAATGNTYGTTQWEDGEAVLRFGVGLQSPTMRLDYFAPQDWLYLDNHDLDLGGTAPMPLDVDDASGVRKLLFTIGKSGEAYLLDRENLGGIGGQLASAAVLAPIAAIASPAVWNGAKGFYLFVEGSGEHCPPGQSAQGLVALKVQASPAAMETVWCASVSGNGSPILTTTDGHSDPLVLIVGAQGDNQLHAFNATTGAVVAQPATTMAGLHHFQTLIAADGRIYVGADDTVYAFAF